MIEKNNIATNLNKQVNLLPVHAANITPKIIRANGFYDLLNRWIVKLLHR
jgi:hypothetical protein